MGENKPLQLSFNGFVKIGFQELVADELEHRLMKTGGRLVKYARYYWLLLAEGHLNRKLFGAMADRVWASPARGG